MPCLAFDFLALETIFCISDNLGTLDQAGLNCIDMPTSASQVLALRVCAISTQLSVA